MHTIKLGQYKDLNIKKTPPMSDEELEQAADNALQDAVQSAQRYAREIQIGDTVLVKIEAQVDGSPVPELSNDRMEYEVGNLSMLPEYAKVAGKKIGQTFEMHIPYSQTCPVAAVRGKTVDFQVRILSAKFSKPAEVTDDVIQMLDPNAKSAEDVKAKLKFMIKNENERSRFENDVLKVMTAIRERAEVTLDGQEYDSTYHQVIEESAKMYEQAGVPLPEGCTDIRKNADFLESCKSVTERVVNENLIIKAVSEAENITISPEEIEQGKKVFTASPEAKEEFEAHFPDDYTFSAFLLRNKVFDAIMNWNLVD